MRDLLADAVGEITQKHGWISISAIELIPDVRLILFAEKIGHQGSLARTGICRYQGDRKPEIGAQAFNQAWPRKHLGRRPRQQQLGPQKKCAGRREFRRRCRICGSGSSWLPGHRLVSQREIFETAAESSTAKSASSINDDGV